MTRYLYRKGVKLAYESYPGISPALVFIHGGGANRSIWRRYLASFENHRRIALDLRAHGKSGLGPISLEEFIEDCRAILVKEKVKECILVGNSLGALVAYHLSSRLKRVQGLILASPLSREYARASWILRPLARFGSWLFSFGPKTRRVFQDYGFDALKPLRDFPLLDFRGTYIHDWLASAHVVLSSTADLRKISHKTVVLLGLRDILVNTHAVRMHAKENPLVTYRALGSHHHLTTVKCDYVISVLRRFVQGIRHG